MKIKYEGKRGKREIRQCQYCTEHFETLSIKVRSDGEKFCSRKCYDEYRKANSNKKKNHIKHQRMYKYNLTEDDFNRMLENCNNSCEICGKPFSDESRYTTPGVDHCHETGKVRGLLCRKCNTAIGMLNDDITLIKKAFEYLNYYKTL